MNPPVAGATTDIVSHIDPGDLEAQLRRDARVGLTSNPKSIPSKYFYDEQGSQLFDEITRLPEYYLTRTEKEILIERAGEIACHTQAATIVELGSGTSEKTCILLDAFCKSGQLERFVPFDVDPDTLHFAAVKLFESYPEIVVSGICGDFEKHLDTLGQPERTMVVFLGSTIGNLDRPQRKNFLRQLVTALKPGDSYLMGIDLVKDVGMIEAAYNDSAGISADFNLNMLSVLNRRLGGDFDLDRFEHVAKFHTEYERMDMRLRSLCDQTVRLRDLGLSIKFAEGELLHTEISCKFRREVIEEELREVGLVPAAWWTDPEQKFALSLSYRA